MKEMGDPENPSAGIRRSRRNLMRIGAIAASAMLANTRAAKAERDDRGHEGRGHGVHCFLRGTSIQTVDGDKRIEDLAAGDLLPTVFGGIRPIQWIGRYRFKKSDPAKAWGKDAVPVRVARSALGPNVPSADLFVSRRHALLLDDVLVPVCNLINGTTITLYDARALEELEFFHIKMEFHDVIFAEGTPCETLLNVDEGAINYSQYLSEYGAPLSSNTPCASMVGFGGRVELKSHFRSAISPWIDRRQQLDIIRDRLDEGETILLRQPELTP